MAIAWKEHYSTGLKKVDAQHKALFAALNRFGELIEAGRPDAPEVVALLEEIARDAVEHFGFEEGCMERYRCPVAKANKLAHDAFLNTLGEYRRRLADEGFSQGLLRELHGTAENWVLLHICHTDVHLRACVKARME